MKDNRSHTKLVHILVMQTFVSETPEGMEICHNNGDDGDNRLDNLRFGTHQENIDDRRRHGTHTRGVDTGAATRFTEGDVRTIRRLNAQGFSYSQIAGMYGVKDKHHIKRIVKRKLWAWVDDPVMLHDSRVNIEKRKAA